MVGEEILRTAVVELLAEFYDEVDDEFIRGILAAMREPPRALSHKSKRVFLVCRGNLTLGLLIATPKRGGALKCSPVIVRSGERECFRSLIENALSSFSLEFRKIYVHLPLLAHILIEGALELGFVPEGILKEPYKRGVDMIVLGRILG